jgi:murein DD-endopeptidase MepM/ murein hydrolase activator NlpD
VTDNGVYRLHFTRATAVGFGLALVALVAGAVGLHFWQLHLAENDLRALQATTAAQHAKLRAIDRRTASLASELRDIQRQDAEIRRQLGVAAAPADKAPPAHAFVPAGSAPTVALVQTRLDRLAHRVLNLRRLAALARDRIIAALPSLNPVGGSISAGFGWRVDPWPEYHRGLDLAADYGTPVHAAADGVVRAAGWESGGFGIKVDVDHENGYHTWYAHLSRVAVAPGERVRKGETIAYVGATGEATGPHLHYQVMLGGQAIDPTPYLNGVPAKLLATLPGAERVQ